MYRITELEQVRLQIRLRFKDFHTNSHVQSSDIYSILFGDKCTNFGDKF